MNDTSRYQAPTKSFGKEKRLLNAGDYSHVFDNAQVRASHKHLLLLANRSTTPQHRLGLVIAKKNVRLAVQRNRIKRLAREFFRTVPAVSSKDNFPLDVVLLTRRGIDQLDNAQVSTILRQQWQKLVRQTTLVESNQNREN